MNTEQRPAPELGESSDAPLSALALRLDQQHIQAPPLIPLSRRQQLLGSVAALSVRGEEAKSPTGSRSTSPQGSRRNPPQLQKALASWNARRRPPQQSPPKAAANSNPAMVGFMAAPSKGLNQRPAASALSFAMQRAQGPTTAVTDNVIEGLRKNMREELLKRLSKSNLGNGSANMAKQSPQVQAAFAKRLEEVLFKTSKSVEAYADSKTLDRRLRMLLAAMQKRKAQKDVGASTAGQHKSQQQKQQVPTEQRKRDALRTVLGQDKLSRVLKVVAEIKLIQLGREVTEGQPFETTPMCTRQGCYFSVPCPQNEKAPKVVRDLFFNTAIVAAYEKSSVERIPTLPWNELLAQGEARLAAYHEWYRQRKGASTGPPNHPSL